MPELVERTVIGTTGAPFSQALSVAGRRHVFISGQLATDEDGRAIDGDLETQARRCFESIASLLAQAGGQLSDVVKITAFVTTLDGYAGYGKIRRQVFGEQLPASSTVQVAGLVTPGCLIEIEAVAVLP